MNKTLAACLLTVLAGLTTNPTAQAQTGSVPRPLPTRAPTPALSPYLDLTRTGDPAINYYLGTLPEIQRRRFEQSAGAAISDLERGQGSPTLSANDLMPPLPQTGHRTTFNNLGGYFGSNSGVTRPGMSPFQNSVTPKK
jgi:hypothetical protein